MGNKKRLQMQRHRTQLGKLTEDIIFDLSGTPICPKCLAPMRPLRAVGGFGIFAPDGEDSLTTFTYRCSDCQLEVDAAF